jgi:hypothetical protein
MQDDEWTITLRDGRRVKFTSQELPDDGAFITAQLRVTTSFIRLC